MECNFKKASLIVKQTCQVLGLISRRWMMTKPSIMERKAPHTPVLANEVVEFLNPQAGQTILDMTFGAGGHSAALLDAQPDLRIFALDRDPVANEFAWQLQATYGSDKVIPLLGKFSDLPLLLKAHNIHQGTLDGVLFDLGCSSMQFDEGERGFSISKDGPLDMRMDGKRNTIGITAADVLKHATASELEQILKYYGEEKHNKIIAFAIVQARYTFKPLSTTSQLCELVEAACNTKFRVDKLQRKSHIATKTFQALRIFVNNEMNELNYGIILAHKFLKTGGKAAAISFHSLEDRIIKRHFQGNIQDNATGALPFEYSDPFHSLNTENVLSITEDIWDTSKKRVVVPSEEEVKNNPRSRSAKLRVAVKVQ